MVHNKDYLVLIYLVWFTYTYPLGAQNTIHTVNSSDFFPHNKKVG